MNKKKQAKKQSHGKGRAGKAFPYELTIGMIVKDDIDQLRTCLQSLQPLRDAISCQLIITDTGSTDGSRELAEEYADLLLDFTWCDDFSKARNTGVERAEGRWFAFIDSDFEFDESISLLVDFFHSKESYQRDCVSVNIRNYKGTEDNMTYIDFAKPLFLNFMNGKRYFQGCIHEYIITNITNASVLPVLVKHWGYVGELGQEKTNRNVPLLIQSIEEDPMELKNYLQIVGELAKQPLEQKKYILKGIEVAKTLISKGKVHQLEEGILANLQLRLSQIARTSNDATLEEEMLQEVEGKFTGTLLELECLGFRLSACIKRKDVSGALPYFHKLQRLYLALQKKPDTHYLYTGFFQCGVDGFYPLHESNLLIIATETGNEHLMAEILPTCFGYKSQNHLGAHHNLQKYMSLAKHFEDAPFLHTMYRYILDSGSTLEQNQMKTLLGHCFLEYQGASYKALLECFSQEQADSLLAPYIYEKHDCSLEACPEVEVFFQDHPQLWTVHYKILLIDYLKTGKDTFSYVKKAPFPLLLEQFQCYWKQTAHPEQLIYDLFSRQSLPCNTWKEKKLCGYLGLQTVHHLSLAEKQEIPEMTRLYQGASAILEEYNHGMYQQHILDTQEMDVVPQVELFAHHSHQAWMVEGDDVAYVTSMKSAMLAHREYQQIVTFFLDVMKEKRHEEIVAKQESRKAHLPLEQSELSLKVKKTLGQLILAGKKEEAIMVLEKYKKINPHDRDLPLLERTCAAI